MASLNLFRKLTISDIAAQLGLRPFEVARILGQEEGLPAVLAFSPDAVDQVREMAGVEAWWEGDALPVADDNRSRALVRSLARKLLDRDLAGGTTTRADNLFRGLEAADQLLIRRVVNQFIRERLLRGVHTATGPHVCIDEEHRETLERIVEGGDIPPSVEALWS